MRFIMLCAVVADANFDMSAISILKRYIEQIIEVNECQNVTFGEKQADGSYKETWGINGIFVTDIRKENNTNNHH